MNREEVQELLEVLELPIEEAWNAAIDGGNQDIVVLITETSADYEIRSYSRRVLVENSRGDDIGIGVPAYETEPRLPPGSAIWLMIAVGEDGDHHVIRLSRIYAPRVGIA